MAGLRTLPVNIDDLGVALEDHSPGAEWFLDTTDGSLVFSSDIVADALPPDIQKLIRRGSPRLVRVEPIASHLGFRVMEEFVRSLDVGPIKERLSWALESSHPFRRFKSVLHDFPDVRSAWLGHHGDALRGFCLEWLSEHDIVSSHPSATGPRGEVEIG